MSWRQGSRNRQERVPTFIVFPQMDGDIEIERDRRDLSRSEVKRPLEGGEPEPSGSNGNSNDGVSDPECDFEPGSSEVDEGDGLYPNLTDTEEAAQLELQSFEQKEKEFLGSTGFDLDVEEQETESESVGSSADIPPPGEIGGYDVTGTGDWADPELTGDVLKVMQHVIEEVVSMEDSELDENINTSNTTIIEEKEEGGLVLSSSKTKKLPPEIPPPPIPPIPQDFQRSKATLTTQLPMTEEKSAETSIIFMERTLTPRSGMGLRTFGGKDQSLSENRAELVRDLTTKLKGLSLEPRRIFPEEKEDVHIHHDKGACHICAPIPDEAITKMKNAVIGLTAKEARMAAFALVKYLKDNKHTETVQDTLKYIEGVGCGLKANGGGERQRNRSWTLSSNGSQWTESEPTTMSTSIGTQCNGNGLSQLNVSGFSGERTTIQTPTPTTMAKAKEQHVVSILRLLTKQNGAWTVFDTEAGDYVVSQIVQLNQLLTVMDSHGIRVAVRSDNYKNLKGLCTYFALEKRTWIRMELINALEVIALKDKNSAKVMVIETDLIADVAKYIIQDFYEPCKSHEWFQSCVNFLGMLLRTGFRLQVEHLDLLDAEFVLYLLSICEGNIAPHGFSCSKDVKESIVSFILSYSAHFSPNEGLQNPIVAAIKNREQDSEFLKQKMISLLLNRKTSRFCNSDVYYPSMWCGYVVKLGMDLLSCPLTAGFFLDNDLNLFLAGLTAYIPQLESGDESRTYGLRCARVILRRLFYQHPGLKNFIKMMKGVLMERDESSAQDQKICRKLAREIEASRRYTSF